MSLTKEAVHKAIMKWPGRYETRDGRLITGAPCSLVPAHLRADGWKRVSQYDHPTELKPLGLKIVEARYVGGTQKKVFCMVVEVEEPTIVTVGEHPFKCNSCGESADLCECEAGIGGA